MWDPRLGGSTPSSCGTATLPTTFGYDTTTGRLTTITPAGLAAWTLGYDSTGRVITAGRTHNSTYGSGTEASSVAYGVPTTADPSHLYYRPDLTSAAVASWGQPDVPSSAVAIFGPGDTVSSTDLRAGDVSYLNSVGRVVNTASFNGSSLTDPAGWHYGSSSYDPTGNVVRTLSPANRELALNPTSAGLGLSSDTIAASNAFADVSSYSSDGMDVVDSYGPYHQVTLPDGSTVPARAHSHYTYDDGSELGHPAGPTRHLQTSVTTGASRSPLAAPTNETDQRTTTTAYALSATDTTGWTYSKPMQVTTDPHGLALSDITRYDPNTGLPIETRMRSNPGGGGAGSTLNIYYTTGPNSQDSACGNHQLWTNLLCKTTPADTQPTPGQPGLISTTITSYDYLNRPLTTVETVQDALGVTQTRTSNTVYDNNGYSPRTHYTETIGGLGAAVPRATLSYDATTGLPITVSNGVTGDIVTGYDDFGRQISYNDGSGATATTTSYDSSGRVATITDTHGTRTYGYNAANPNTPGEQRGLPTKLTVSGLGDFTAAYNPDGKLSTESWPNGVLETWTSDPAGQTTALNAQRVSTVWLTDTVKPSIYGQWLSEASFINATSGSQGGTKTYAYDHAGRLNQVQDTPTGGSCTTRAYTFDANSNRLTSTSYPPSGGACQSSSGATFTSHAYDSADRLLATGTDTGLTYDAFGRSTTLPAADTTNPGGGNVTASYFNNDLAKSLSQGSNTITWTLDAAQRQAVRSDQTGNVTTNHYADWGDSPAWIGENTNGSAWTRNVTDLTGNLTASLNQTGSATYQVTNLHGDTSATAPTTANQPAVGYATDEFGTPQGSTPGRYGWLGGKQRASDAPGGLTLMGVRLYSPVIGRFLQTDPIPGGGANAYDYAAQDPVNKLDPTGLRVARDDR